MGKSTKAKASPRPAATEIEEEVLSKVTALKNEGNKLFAKRDYVKALEQYEQAVKVLPDGAGEKVDLFCNKAACFYQMKRFKEASKECTNALQLAPSSSKALQRRARSLEQQGLYKQALSDIQAVNRSDAATDESRDTERRLRDALAGRRPAGLGRSALPQAGSANGAGAVTAPAAQAAPRNQMLAFTAKVALGGETRLLHFTSSSSYAQLLDGVRSKFPDAGPFMLKYTDKDGDDVTLTNRNDVRAAIQDLLAASSAPKGGVPPITPPLKLSCVPCGEAEVPQPPEDEQQQLAAIKRNQEALQARLAAARSAERAEQERPSSQVAHTPSGEVVEIDDWLIDFANLFRDVSGLDADRHIEFHNEGWDATTRAMEAALRSEEATPLFESAAERFREVTCSGLLNWGNVSVCIAHKLLDSVAEKEAALDDETVAKAAAEFDKAEARYNEALRFHPTFFDGLCALGQLEFERAKLRAKLVVKPAAPAPPPAPAGGADGDAGAAEALQAAQGAALREALKSVKKEDVDAAKPHMAKAAEWYKQALAAGEAADAKRKQDEEDRRARAAAKQQQKGGGADAGTAAAAAPAAAADAARPDGEAVTFLAQALIMEGNVLYEWSQLLAAVGDEWRPAVDAAVERFKGASCSDADVRNALKNHTHAGELDLGPEPEPEAEAEAVPAAAAAGDAGKQQPEHAKAKGLPSLEVKKKAAA